MPVTLRTSAALRPLLGGESQKQIEGATIGELLDALGIRDRLCDAEGNVRRHFNIHINEGEEVRLLAGLDTPVHDGDTVTILSAIAGGGNQAPRNMTRGPANHAAKRSLIRQAACTSGFPANVGIPVEPAGDGAVE